VSDDTNSKIVGMHYDIELQENRFDTSRQDQLLVMCRKKVNCSDVIGSELLCSLNVVDILGSYKCSGGLIN
jgi:hypothetical protein